MTTEADAVAKLAKAADENVAVSAVIKLEDGREFVARRNDFVLDQITPANKAKVYLPQNVVQHVKLTDSLSLTHYMNRFRNDDSILFADIATNRINGVIDYHHTSGDELTTCKAELVKHQATLTLPFSKEWETWTRSNEKLMRHVDFASFLEENALDVVNPVGADLLEICRDLQVKQDAHFKSSVRMGDTVSLSYSKDEDTTTKDNMSLPTEFTIAIPVYFNEPAVTVRCMTRRKIDDGELSLGYKMIRAENIRQADFQRIVSMIEGDTTLTAVYGTLG